MNWVQVLTIIAANFGFTLTLFLWIRKEANADRKELSASISSCKNELRDFHGRLCTLEERTRE